MKETIAHPYMANSAPALKREMLDAIGAKSIEELFQQIPADHRLKSPINLPPALTESQLRRHLVDTLSKNKTCEQNLNFLGAGCWQHHVPAACDEVVRRNEWLTSVFGEPSSDHGRNQAWFEFCSQLGELLEMDLVALPVRSWGVAAGHAIRMAARLTGRDEVIVVRAIDPERLSVIENYCEPVDMPSHIAVRLVDFDKKTGLMDLSHLRSLVGPNTAAVYFETPSYLGMIEHQGSEIAAIAHTAGAEVIVGVDPISLGVLAAPVDYGADIVVGTTQPLGVHMNCGGGVSGFIASRDEERYAHQYPTLFISIAETTKPGEYGFGLSLFEQSSYGLRDKGNDWTGHSVYMWAIANAVYMAMMGPTGFEEVGNVILQRAHFAARRLAEIPGVRVTFPNGFFKEFIVNFDQTNLAVADINKKLLTLGIFGGKDLSQDFPELGASALYCVTEIHTHADIERLANALNKVINHE
ncbi:aminomethyl-transferring glycine dehydrogenase subunit GcvPA [Noviherbaspirillum sp. CPCC 100848]|uniref:Aminomethyl-transferring glycine dehydrogenase subunit GcvPA n=1 Tax=Noviherbaspirillum album TaxID=3080276 RepID=A0ABU6JHZ9_9BURK|nr:aminomethyl-transferring glycine dehydrogenase subunit GcvPA [Noviherbaspirillum sp. CPCC 100848]MEC4722714.1 aminomethyl-transferring glycine dehydrogenase subunit GcvPA [Noviherbaspirillum sp. CPCC 100848]